MSKKPKTEKERKTFKYKLKRNLSIFRMVLYSLLLVLAGLKLFHSKFSGAAIFCFVSFLFCIGVAIYSFIKNKKKHAKELLFKYEKKASGIDTKEESSEELDMSDYIDDTEYDYSTTRLPKLKDDDIADNCDDEYDDDSDDDDD